MHMLWPSETSAAEGPGSYYVLRDLKTLGRWGGE